MRRLSHIEAFLLLLVWASITSFSGRAAAQDVATAEALFVKGLEDMNAGHFDTGCPALKESQRIDPTPGTLFTLAECEAKAGLFATAVARYEDYLQVFERLPVAAQKRQLGREKIAAAQKQALGPLVPTLTVVLAPSAPKGTRIRRDDVELAGPALGLPLPVDPGDHVLTVSPPGRPDIEQKITLQKGEKRTVVLEVPPPEPPKPPETKVEEKPKPAPPLTPTPTPPSNAKTGSSRVPAFVVGGIGVAAVGVGAVTGIMAIGKKDTIDTHCNGPACDSTGLEAAQSGQSLALVSTIGMGIGLAGLATSAVLFLVSPREEKKTTTGTLSFGVEPAPWGGATVHAGGKW